jgi:hypothetical protein
VERWWGRSEPGLLVEPQEATSSRPGAVRATARLNGRAATPNAVRDRDNNAKEYPPSGATALDHVPADTELKPKTPPIAPVSPIPPNADADVSISSAPDAVSANTNQEVIKPVDPVPKKNSLNDALALVMFCTPSDSEKASGDTAVYGMFVPNGLANVTVARTRSLVVYGPLAKVNGFPVYKYVMGAANIGWVTSAAVMAIAKDNMSLVFIGL